MKRIALVGAGGFVGARFVEMSRLDPDLCSGCEIVPIVRAPRNLGVLARFGITNHCFGNAANRTSLSRALAGCDTVINLTVGDNARTVPDLENLLAVCTEQSVRLLVHLSSAEIYGRADQPDLNDNSEWFRRHWMEYARAKGRAEDWLRRQPQKGSPTVVVLRPGLVWGPGSMWVVAAAQAISNQQAVLVDGGKWACNLCFVDNLVDQILTVAAAPAPRPGFYNVGDPTRPTWREFYAALSTEMGFLVSDFSSITESAYRESILAKLSQVRELSAFHFLKRAFRNQTKMKIKFWLQELARRYRPQPVPGATSIPRISKNLWWLQTTRYQLPISVFSETFSPSRQVDFSEAMRRTGEWLRHAGFVNPARETCSPPQ